GLRIDAEHPPGLRRKRDGLRVTPVYASAGADPRRVVIRPRGSRQAEEPRALFEGGDRVGVGIDEDVDVVEGGEESDVPGVDEAVPEHVPAHVPYPRDRERLPVRV